MKKFSFATAFVSFLLLYNVDAFSVDNIDKNHENQKKLVNLVKNNEYVKQANLHPSIKSYHRIDLGGKVLSYAWFTNNSEKMQDHGVKLDGVLNIKSINNNSDLGIFYGGNFQLAIPAVKSENFIPSMKAYNRGAQLFVESGYGNLSFGYQEGVESIMKIDASSIGAGDNSIAWLQYTNLSNLDGKVQYQVFPGLYSESVFNRSNNNVISIKDKDFVNNLPFRISYQSPNFMGVKFGISYSPTGYDSNLFESVSSYNIKKLTLPPVISADTTSEIQANPNDKDNILYNALGKEKVQDVTIEGIVPSKIEFLQARYENIVSAGLSYNHSFNDIDFQASVVGEYGSTDIDKLKSYSKYPSAENLAAFAIGTSVTYRDVIVAGSYGYLGKSGYINTIYSATEAPLKMFSPDNQYTYYWNIGAKYVYSNASISTSYFRSNKVNTHFYDFSLGIDYNLSLSSSHKGQYKVFGNYHYFNIDNKNFKVSRDGSVLLLGVKYEF
ncbi:hypothetical protein ECHHL_0460 [Ehrlichia chaffeensis str. Heartland]|uniref:hypothetical protein n=1 Tax=Ehrlichia chaffeensis TaxID=945 RepID=UPI000444E388|nr:hypothetical protein [Ehrlichia chaffeensis]AHX03621.1 hypothetical protein ECHHL_0460 [Ehrlichia chaffeensis str. Heartland]AHX08843.1 hypothetical protein ECHSTV_0586 [Ehrlichia chaffeensis str. Saint Vincent]AHX10882.1 hypothetical protein ECHWP_0457 [Ehrlichia chaffeensis str. West Paces]